MRAAAGMTISLLKLRIGVAIAASALAGIAVASGPGLAWWQVVGTDAGRARCLRRGRRLQPLLRARPRPLDAAHPRRVRSRAARFKASPWWPVALPRSACGLAGTGLGDCAGHVAAAYVFLGAFTYGIVYTVWLKRRSTWNIVVGGLAGSFAVLAGAAAVDPIAAGRSDRAGGGAVPVDAAAFLEPRGRQGRGLRQGGHPDAAGRRAGACLDLGDPGAFGGAGRDLAGPALVRRRPALRARRGIGGGYFVWKSVMLYRDPSKANAMAQFLRFAAAACPAGRRARALERRGDWVLP